jgi:hypothetical protein
MAVVINMAVIILCQAIPRILLPTTRAQYVFSSKDSLVTTAGTFSKSPGNRMFGPI